MSPTVLKLKPSRNEAACNADKAARDAAMEAVAGLVRNAGGARQREAMGRRIIRYAAMCLAAAIGVRAAAQYLAALAGQMFEEAEEVRA